MRGVFRGQRNVTVHMATVTAIDLDARTVTLDRGDGVVDELRYDTLVIAAGAVSTSYGIDGVDEHTIPLKDLDDALDLRLAVLERFERAASDPAASLDGELNVVVCGGGPTGVETAGAMMELFTRVLAKDFPTVDVRAVRVVLVEAAPRLLGAMSTKSSDRARRTLSRRGVEVRTGVGVARITTDGNGDLVHLADGTVLPAGVVVWAAGVRGQPAGRDARCRAHQGRTDRRRRRSHGARTPRRVRRRRHRRVAGTVVGGTDGTAILPQVAQVAIQVAATPPGRSSAAWPGAPSEPFRYRDKGTMATIGRNDAVTELPNGVRLSGLPGWLAWLGLHLVYLIGFRNRANVLLNWAWNYAHVRSPQPHRRRP